MTIRKQSKKSWRKRGLPFEEATLVTRERADQDRRTGGSLEYLSDEKLFVLDAGAGSGGAAARSAKRCKHPTTIFVDRNVAVNSHIPVINKQRQLADIARAKAPSPLKQTITKLRAKASRRQEQRSAAAAAIPFPNRRGCLWEASLPAINLRSRPLDSWGASVDPVKYRPRRPGTMATAAVAHVIPGTEGTSYNPSRDAHQQLLEEAVAHELERQRQARIHSSAALSGREEMEEYCPDGKESKAEEEGDALCAIKQAYEQTSARKCYTADCAAAEGIEDEKDVSRPILRAKLTSAQRNRQRQHKERLAREAVAAKQRKADRQFARMVAIQSEIKKDETQLVKRQRVVQERTARRQMRLGRERYKEPRVEVLLTEELPSSLCAMPTPERGLLHDRYDSMQQRNMLEPRKCKLALKRKSKRREYTREGHKDTRFKSPHAMTSGLQMPVWI